MKRRWQFSLAYIFLETFWVAATLAQVREAYWLYFRHRDFFDGWNPPEKELVFAILVVGAIFCGSTAVGGVFGRMTLGALVAVSAFVGVLALLAICAVFSPAIQ